MFPNSTPINPIDESLIEPYYDTCQNMGITNGKELLETAKQLWQKALDWSYPTENPFEWLLDQKTMLDKKKERDLWFDKNIEDDHMRHFLHYGNTNQIYYQFMEKSFPIGFDKEFWMNTLVSCAIIKPPKETINKKATVKKATDEKIKQLRKEELLKEFFSYEEDKKKQQKELKKVHQDIFVNETYDTYFF